MTHATEQDLLERIEKLEAQVARYSEAEVAEQTPHEERSTRRGMLRLAGAVVVGGTAASLLGAQPAAATTGNMQFGASNDAGTVGTSLTSSNSATTLYVDNTNGTGSPTAVWGTGSGNGTGVFAQINSPGPAGFAVYGQVNGSDGCALVGQGGAAQLVLLPGGGTAAPSSGDHSAGEVVSNAGGLFACVGAGTPGTWRKLVGPATAGAFHAITPTRVYDSRAAEPFPGLLAAGTDRLVSVADGRNSIGTVITPDLVPIGATAVAANVTVTGTTGVGGYLAVNPGGVTVVTASTINWFGAGQNLANGVALTLNGAREVTVVCGPGGGNTHFIIDVAGYYL